MRVAVIIGLIIWQAIQGAVVASDKKQPELRDLFYGEALFMS